MRSVLDQFVRVVPCPYMVPGADLTRVVRGWRKDTQRPKEKVGSDGPGSLMEKLKFPEAQHVSRKQRGRVIEYNRTRRGLWHIDKEAGFMAYS